MRWVSSFLQMSWSVVSKKGKKRYMQCNEQTFHNEACKALKFRHSYCTNTNQGSSIYRKKLSFCMNNLGAKGVFKIL